MNGVFSSALRRECLLAVRQLADLATPLLFFVLVGLLFVLGLEPRPELLQTVGPGVVWVAALLASLLGAERLFRADLESGVLELLALGPEPLTLSMLGKMTAHWLVTALPLLLLAPLLGLMLGLPGSAIAPLVAGLALGTPVLTILCSLGAALTVSLRSGGTLLALVVLPLTVPVLIFGSRVGTAAVEGVSSEGGLMWLAVLAVLAVSLGPPVVAAAVRVSLE